MQNLFSLAFGLQIQICITGYISKIKPGCAVFK